MKIAKAIFVGLLAFGIGLIFIGLGFREAGSGVGGFVSGVGSAVRLYPQIGMLLALISLGITGFVLAKLISSPD